MSVHSRKLKTRLVWYVAYYPGGKKAGQKKVRCPDTVTTREQAERWEKMFVGNRPSSTPAAGPAGPLTVKHLWPQYVAYAKLHRALSTADDIFQCGKHLIRILGAVELRYITRAYIDLYKTTRQGESVVNRTINKELSWFSGFGSGPSELSA